MTPLFFYLETYSLFSICSLVLASFVLHGILEVNFQKVPEQSFSKSKPSARRHGTTNGNFPSNQKDPDDPKKKKKVLEE